MRTDSKSTGIYAIHCRNNDFIYIGSAAGQQGFYGRLAKHRSALKHNKHHSPILQKHFNRYGESAFDFYILELCDRLKCEEREQAWLSLRGIGSENKSYNISSIVGRVPSPLGRKQSESFKQNLRQLNSDRVWLESSKEKIANANSLDFVITTPSGEEICIKNLAAFCRAHNLTKTRMVSVAKGKAIAHKGYKCRYASESREDQELRRRVREGRSYLITNVSGEVFRSESLYAFCQAKGLNHSAMSSVARGERRHHKGWQCRLDNEAKEVTQKRESLKGRKSRYIITTPDSRVLEVKDLTLFCQERGLDVSGMIKVAKGKRSHYKNYRCEYAPSICCFPVGACIGN